jgi:hypothetical protein
VRPDGTKSLFTPGATFELARRSDGTVQITFHGERVSAKIEQVVGDLLAHQSEYAVAALLDPGTSGRRSASAGSWIPST